MTDRDRRAATRSAATASPRIRAIAEICTVTHAASRKTGGRAASTQNPSGNSGQSVLNRPGHMPGRDDDISANVAADPFHRDLLIGAVGHDLVERLLHRSLQLGLFLRMAMPMATLPPSMSGVSSLRTFCPVSLIATMTGMLSTTMASTRPEFSSSISSGRPL